MAVNILDVSCNAETGVVTVIAGSPLHPTRVASRVDGLDQAGVDAVVELVRLGPVTPGASMFVSGQSLVDLPARPTEVHTWDWATLSWTAELEDFRALRLRDLKRARDAVEFSDFTYAGYVLDGDAEAQRRLATLVSVSKTAIASGYPFTKEFTLADNSVVEFTAEDFLGIEMAKIWQVEAAFTKYRALRAQAEAATTVEEIEAITWD